MKAYSGFAEVYDLFMDNVPYDTWSENIKKMLRERGVEDGLVLDLGCGTGKMTRRLADAGYDMIAVDVSPEMLDIALGAEKDANRILYLCQDMREFELYGTVRAVVSICDTINYLLSTEELAQVFRLVNNYLDPDGIFIFDLNTVYKYETQLGECTIAENRKEGSFIWENTYDQTERINEYDMTFFVREGELFRKYEEVHYQRAFTIEEIKKAISESGMKFEAVYDADTMGAVGNESERIYVIARECGKRGR